MAKSDGRHAVIIPKDETELLAWIFSAAKKETRQPNNFVIHILKQEMKRRKNLESKDRDLP
jgi:hypothetical protein